MSTGSEGTRQRLLRAAAVEIARHGYRGASLRGVAAGADIRAASIFHYFPGGKEELVRAALDHIMQTIATRMTPSIGAGGALPPADLIVHCTALLWDFMAENPAYAGALMRGAFEPDSVIADAVRQPAEQVVRLAEGYITACQGEGSLSSFDPRRLLFRIGSFVITFHGAPSMRQYILGSTASSTAERDVFLQALRADITP